MGTESGKQMSFKQTNKKNQQIAIKIFTFQFEFQVQFHF